MGLPQRLTDGVAAFVLAGFSVTVGLGVGLGVGGSSGMLFGTVAGGVVGLMFIIGLFDFSNEDPSSGPGG